MNFYSLIGENFEHFASSVTFEGVCFQNLLTANAISSGKAWSTIIKLHLAIVLLQLAQKKLPKWLRNICITKKCVFNNLKKITHYYNNGFEEYIYIYNRR